MKIKINEPCDADWSKMKIGIQSRHCELCVKSVMDFTQMTRQEIIEYLFKNQNQSTCGRMVGGQMDFRIADFEAVIEGNRRKQGNYPFFVLSFAALAMMSCGNGIVIDNYDPVVGELIEMPQAVDSNTVIHEPKDSTKCNSLVAKLPISIDISHIAGGIEIETGEMIMVPDPEPIVDGKIAVVHPVEPFIMGDMAAPIELMGDTVVLVSDFVVSYAEKMPEYAGGMEALMAYLEVETKYPKKAEKKEVEGKVYVQFLVQKDGSITEPNVIKGIGEGCDEEALRVVRSMPNWIAGENKGEKVIVKYVLPFSFQLK